MALKITPIKTKFNVVSNASKMSVVKCTSCQFVLGHQWGTTIQIKGQSSSFIAGITTNVTCPRCATVNAL